MKFENIINDQLLKKAIEIATKAHKGQVDLAGLPYITHPLRVMKQLNSTKEKIIAVLHDTIEDTHITYEDIKKEFGVEIADAVKALTKIKNQSYDEYVKNAIKNKLAKPVKIADLKDNLNKNRLNKLPNDMKNKLIKKYAEVLKRISG